MTDESNSEMSTDFGFYDVPKNNINASPVTYGPYNKLILEKWKQCGLHLGVLQAFDKMNIKEMTSIQKHCFSYLMSNFNTVIVGSSKGKTISYLARIISSMMYDNKIDKSNLKIGPYTIILTHSLESCSQIKCVLKTILSALDKEISVLVVDLLNSMCYLEASFLHGCHILISTPANLIILLNNIKYFSWLNLKYFVFENIDILMDNYQDEMVTILIESKEPKNCSSEGTQMISTSVRWTKDMDKLFEIFFKQWQYVFGCHLEAALYMNMGFHVVHFKKNKLKLISWYLKNNFTRGRLVLITSNSDKLPVIHKYIQEHNSDIDILLADPNKSVLTLINWNNPLEKSKRLLICSDDIMFDCYIDNADYLIHYDISAKKFKFQERFSFLLDSNNILRKNKISSYAFLTKDPVDMLMMPKVVEIMKYFGDVDSILEQVAGFQLFNQEKNKKTFLCNKLLQFGDCPEQLSCKNRHIAIKEIDKSADNIPMKGLAEVEILNVYDASHMSANLLSFNCSNDLTNDWSTFKDNSDTIKHELSLFYSDPESRISLENLKLGNKVAVELETNTNGVINSEYFRATVIDENTMNSSVKVKLIDKGLVEIVSKQKVFSLPHHLQKLQTITVDVYLLSVKPAFLDKSWHPKANLDVKEKIIGHRVIIDIQFSLGNTVWINKMYNKCFSPTSIKFDIKTIIPDMLFQGNYGTENRLHYNKLLALLIAAGIDVFEQKEIKNDNESNIEKTTPKFNHLIEWENLDENLTLVDIDYFISPELFYLRKADNVEGLRGLQEYINYSIAQNELKPLKNIVKGEIGLAFRKESNQYSRMMIFKVLNAMFVEILFVDYGGFGTVSSNSLLSTLPYLISLLPFQAIECSLFGISDVIPSGLDVVDSRFELIKEPVHVQVVKVAAPKFTGGHHYKVNVHRKNSNINELLKEMYNELIYNLTGDIID